MPSLRWKNLIGAGRSVHGEDGLLRVDANVNKNQFRTERQNIVAHYMDPVSSRLMVQYLVGAKELETYWIHYLGCEREPAFHQGGETFEDDADEEDYDPRVIASLIGEEDDNEPEAHADERQQPMFPQSALLFNIVPLRGLPSAGDVRRALERVWSAIGISNLKTRIWRQAASIWHDRIIVPSLVSESASQAGHLQMGHRPSTGLAQYGQVLNDTSPEPFLLRLKSREISTKWHDLLGLCEYTSSPSPSFTDTDLPVPTSSTEGSSDYLSHSLSLPAETGALAVSMNSAAASEHLLREFNKLHKHDFLGQWQHDATLAMHYGPQLRHLLIAPTGYGKTLMAMPFFSSRLGISVLVEPFIALLEDQAARLNALRVKVQIFHNHDFQYNGATVVVVSADVALGHRFLTWIASAQQHPGIERVVLDECHVYLLDSNYRNRLKCISRLTNSLAVAKTRIIAMTATLSPDYETELLQRFGWDGQDVCRTRRATMRTNLQISVIENISLNDIATQVVDVLQSKTKADLVLVYSSRVTYVNDICDKLSAMNVSALPYFADLDNAKKTANREAWRSGASCDVLCCTTAFGCGIDEKHVRYVFHYGSPYSIHEAAQVRPRIFCPGSVYSIIEL